jgi:hypothetical protein
LCHKFHERSGKKKTWATNSIVNTKSVAANCNHDDETYMDEAQRLEEKRAYNRLVSARAREKTKQTIASLEATVVTLSNRVHELEQTRDLLFEQVRLIADEKLKIERALLRFIQDRQAGIATSVPPPQQAPASTTNSDSQALLTAVLRENALGAAHPYGTTDPPPMSGAPHAATHSSAAAGATAAPQPQQQRIDLVGASLLNALLRGGNANTSNAAPSTQSLASSQQYPPGVVAPPRPPPRGSATTLFPPCTPHDTQQPAWLAHPSQRTEQELEILQLLQRMDRRRMEDRNNMSG